MVRAALGLLVFTVTAWVQAHDRISTEGRVAAPAPEVWSAWATDEGLQSWLAPHATIDLRVGGLMRVNYNPAGRLGDPNTIENTILAFDPERMLSIKVTTAPDGFPYEREIQAMWTVMYFEPVSDDATLVRVVSLGFGADEASQRMREFFEQGNAATVEQLQRRFAPEP
jgi:uncharacterized protein YndB with AHSA1/START domain